MGFLKNLLGNRDKSNNHEEVVEYDNSQIIDNSEDFENVKLYSYQLLFYDVKKEQIDYLIAQMQNYDWDAGFAISECFLTKDDEKIIFKFTSSKAFDDKDEENWTEEDLDENLLTRMIGKEQFFSGIFFSELGIEDKRVVFVDSNNNEYNVDISKDSDLEKL